jgi:hypothetical protein
VGSVVAGLRSLPRAARRAAGIGALFVVGVTLLFVAVDTWQTRDVTSAEPPTASPSPTPTPEPAPPVDEPDAGSGPDAEAPADGTPDTGGSTPEPAPAPAPAPTGPAPSSVSVQILNGIGADGSDAVTRVNAALVDAGFRVVARNTGRPYDVTTIFYTTGFEAEARLVGTVLGVSEIRAMTELPPERRLSSSVMVHLIVGADRR